MSIAIREITTDDADQVSSLSGQLGYTINAADTAGQIQAISASNDDVALVAVSEGKVVGWIHVFHTRRIESPSFCEIGGLVVDEQYRGQGIGRQLIDAVKPWCVAKGCGKVKVRSNAKREAAHNFYIHVGLTELKLQKVFELPLD